LGEDWVVDGEGGEGRGGEESESNECGVHCDDDSWNYDTEKRREGGRTMKARKNEWE
jgi:hypothetical protein